MSSERNRPRVVPDTNIFISALLFGGTPLQIIELARENRILLLTSSDILFELAGVLQVKFKFKKKTALDVISEIKRISAVVFVRSKLRVIEKDPADNRVLECAFDGRADCLITGDKKHLLPLKSYRGIPILRPQEFIKKYDY